MPNNPEYEFNDIGCNNVVVYYTGRDVKGNRVYGEPGVFGGLTKRYQKYKTWKSPPYLAGPCCGETKKGNDGRTYKSQCNLYGWRGDKYFKDYKEQGWSKCDYIIDQGNQGHEAARCSWKKLPTAEELEAKAAKEKTKKEAAAKKKAEKEAKKKAKLEAAAKKKAEKEAKKKAEKEAKKKAKLEAVAKKKAEKEAKKKAEKEAKKKAEQAVKKKKTNKNKKKKSPKKPKKSPKKPKKSPKKNQESKIKN